jgi:dehydrogenase/reductase SDR family protein 7
LQLDILVNNAGRSQRANWEDIEVGVDREMFDLNVFGVVALSRIVVCYFQKKKEGHIVVTSSLAGVKATPFSGSYTGAKHAIHVSVSFLMSFILPSSPHQFSAVLDCLFNVFVAVLYVWRCTNIGD